MNDLNMTPQTHIIANAIDWLVTQDTAPSLNDIAARYDYDPAHFQKLFKSHVGVSPKQFTQYMYYKRARMRPINRALAVKGVCMIYFYP
jgi:methylphosphotriester-DNA--protein-cysteine methyltransferase